LMDGQRKLALAGPNCCPWQVQPVRSLRTKNDENFQLTLLNEELLQGGSFYFVQVSGFFVPAG
jgi:hypothetical protein